MNPDSLQTSFWVMILIQTIGSVDTPGSGARKMPAPRQYVAILVTWAVLQIVSSFGRTAERATTLIGWILVLTGMVIGPFGQRVTSLFNTVGVEFNQENLSPVVTAARQRAADLAGIPPSQVSTISPNPPVRLRGSR